MKLKLSSQIRVVICASLALTTSCGGIEQDSFFSQASQRRTSHLDFELNGKGKSVIAGRISSAIKEAPQEFPASSPAAIEYYLEEWDGTGSTAEPTGRKLRLFFRQLPKGTYLHGTMVTVEGTDAGASVVVDGPDKVVMMERSDRAMQLTASAFTGQRSVAVLMVNFSDMQLGCSKDALTKMFFGTTNSVNALYFESSYQRVGVVGDVFGPFTLANVSSSSGCSFGTWESQVSQLAQAAGVDLTKYQHVFYEFPKINSCASSMSGWATVGGGTACSFYCNSVGSATHELGHNFGLWHAETPTDEYGDTSDDMGNFWSIGGQLAHNNAPHKSQLGWLTTPTVGAGTYTVTNLTDSSAGAVKVGIDPSTHYYVSFRAPVGYDIGLPARFRHAVSVHKFEASGATNSSLEATLVDGASYADAVNGITITQNSHDALGASITISAVCAKKAPVVTLSPTLQYGFSGGSLTYSVVVSNQDQSTCAASDFNVTSQVPSGWQAVASRSSVQLAPGSSASFSLTVTAPGGTIDGMYAVSLIATDRSTTAHSGSGIATFAIDTTPPSAPTNVVVTSPKRGTVTVKWSVATDNIKVTSYTVYGDGVKLGTVTTTSYTIKRQRPGSQHSYYVVANDGAGNSSAPSATATIIVR